MCTCVYYVRVHVWERVHVGGGVAHVSVPVCICVHRACASVRVYLPCVGMSLHACVHVCVHIRVQVCVHVWVCVSVCA